MLITLSPSILLACYGILSCLVNPRRARLDGSDGVRERSDSRVCRVPLLSHRCTRRSSRDKVLVSKTTRWPNTHDTKPDLQVSHTAHGNDACRSFPRIAHPARLLADVIQIHAFDTTPRAASRSCDVHISCPTSDACRPRTRTSTPSRPLRRSLYLRDYLRRSPRAAARRRSRTRSVSSSFSSDPSQRFCDRVGVTVARCVRAHR